ncbi:MAG: SRPBCC domain-containing protein [Solirubrobacteraceae bacterium]
MTYGNLETVDDKSVISFERRLEHSVERVWKAISEPDERRHWFPPGGDLTVTDSEPPRLLALSWFGDQLRFELRPDGEGCVLLFSHAFADREKAARDAAGWDRCFVRFDALLAGEPIGEADSLKAWPETHERYAERFGIDPELGRKTFTEYQARQ